jgi:glycosyltransferase involved in cell wall biosynthesis
MISYCIAHKDRTDLFEINLSSLANQTDKDFEVVIADNSSDTAPICALVKKYRELGLQIQLHFVDHKLIDLKLTHSLEKINPALQQNIAVRKAKGDIIVLTSPEVVNATTNVEQIKNQFKDGKKKFVYAWINEQPAENVKPFISTDFSSTFLKSKYSIKCGEAVCNRSNWRDCAYFLGAMRKQDFVAIQGIEELFMNGQGYEDDDFIRRVRLSGVELILDEEISGLHLCHPRSHWSKLPLNDKLFALFRDSNTLVANQGRDWGSFKCITRSV